MSAPSPYTGLSTEVQNALNELNTDSSQYIPQRDAKELFNIPEGVQIFFLKDDGHVSTFSEPNSLRIFQFQQDSLDSTNTFLQVGGWTHPLIAGASPCLQAENGAIMFPDIYSEQPNSSVGLVLVDDVPSEVRAQLISLLEQHTAFKSQNLLPPDQRLGTVGRTIVKGADLVAQGLEYGADKAGILIEYVTEKGQERMSKCEEDAKVSSTMKVTVDAAKTVTNASVKVSGYVADRVGNLTKSLAGYLASKVDKPISGTVSTVTGGSKSNQTKGWIFDKGAMHYLVDAARGGLSAYGTVYNGLETAAKVLGEQVKVNSVMVVKHKYGVEAGDVFGDAATSAGNAAMTYMNIQSLGAKGLMKKTAKETGKSVAKNVFKAHEPESEGAPVPPVRTKKADAVTQETK